MNHCLCLVFGRHSGLSEPITDHLTSKETSFHTFGATMKFYLRSLAVFFGVLAFSVAGFSADASSLKPPPGAKVAIVMFEDLECPDCARAYPVVWEAAKAHHIPVVLHDFPLSKHPWSFQAAVYARYFDTKSEKLGE